jgi:hypothetical protein
MRPIYLSLRPSLGRRIDVSRLPDSVAVSTLIVALDDPVVLVRDGQGTICRIMCVGRSPVFRGFPATRRNAAS